LTWEEHAGDDLLVDKDGGFERVFHVFDINFFAIVNKNGAKEAITATRIEHSGVIS
jgi:hypothetical protein